jgi:hypothetical protein
MKISTIADARAERIRSEAIADSLMKMSPEEKKAAAQRAAMAELIGMDPRIGCLMRKGMPICYCFIEGEYHEGSRAEIEALLGLHS